MGIEVIYLMLFTNPNPNLNLLSNLEWKKFGDRFPKNYQKLKLLGRGGFSLVWLGQKTDTNEIFAIKQISS